MKAARHQSSALASATVALLKRNGRLPAGQLAVVWQPPLAGQFPVISAPHAMHVEVVPDQYVWWQLCSGPVEQGLGPQALGSSMVLAGMLAVSTSQCVNALQGSCIW